MLFRMTGKEEGDALAVAICDGGVERLRRGKNDGYSRGSLFGMTGKEEDDAVAVAKGEMVVVHGGLSGSDDGVPGLGLK